jgi:hypothetical protein
LIKRKVCKILNKNILTLFIHPNEYKNYKLRDSVVLFKDSEKTENEKPKIKP